MKCYVDTYGNILSSEDEDHHSPWSFNIIPKNELDQFNPPGEDWKDIIEVSYNEYNEFIELKNRLRSLQDKFYDRLEY